MGEVVTFSDEARRDLAWTDFQEVAAKAIDDPRLLLDRDFFDDYRRKKLRYERLADAAERVR